MTTARQACWFLRANGPLMARKINYCLKRSRPRFGITVLTWAFVVERVTGIEPALSAWELDRSTPVRPLTSQLGTSGVAVVDRS